MGVPATVARFFDVTRTPIAQLEAYLRPSLQVYCDERSYSCILRRKQVASLSEKLESGRYERLSLIDDLLAATVVIPTVSHEPGVLGFLREILVPVEERLRNTTQKAPDVFRFDATRFIGRLRVQEGLEYPRGTDRLLCEVQIRTAFEHAWSVVTHDLVYKSDDRDWGKQRLAAQLKASVEQIELLIATFQGSAAALPTSAHPETEAQSRIVEVLKALVGDVIPTELVPASWSRLAENVYALVGSYSGSRYATPTAVDNLLTSMLDSLESGTLEVPVSGSLFQLIVAEVSSGRVRGANIDRHRIVPSQELTELYGISQVPMPVEIDWDI